MLQYVVRRLVYGVVTLLALSIIVFTSAAEHRRRRRSTG